MEYVRAEIGVDWISASMPSGINPSAEWYQECISIIERLGDEGNEVCDRTLNGYVGSAVGNCFCGAREGGYAVQLSGNAAQRFWKDVYRLECHISRIDIQATAFFAGDSTLYGQHLYEVAKVAADSTKGNRKRSVTRYEKNDGGYTVYIGSRDSDMHLCIYNKEAETKSQVYEGAWRFELRFKNDYATALANSLFCRQVGTNDAVLSTIRTWASQRGIDVPWPENGHTELSYTCIKGKTDKDTALWWLAQQVRPALAKARKMGYYQDALAALGVVESSRKEVETLVLDDSLLDLSTG
jgi:hypothetical protein